MGGLIAAGLRIACLDFLGLDGRLMIKRGEGGEVEKISKLLMAAGIIGVLGTVIMRVMGTKILVVGSHGLSAANCLLFAVSLIVVGLGLSKLTKK